MSAVGCEPHPTYPGVSIGLAESSKSTSAQGCSLPGKHM